jgi:hypothetical protein
MSLVYVRRLQNRTDYFAIFLTAISGRPALEAFIWFTAYAIWHVAAATKPQMPVIPPNPRLAKVGIAAVEPIDEVDGQTVFDWWKASRPPLALPRTSRLY